MIRTAIVQARSKGEFSTYAGYAVVTQLDKWIASLKAFEIPFEDYRDDDRYLGGARLQGPPTTGGRPALRRDVWGDTPD